MGALAWRVLSALVLAPLAIAAVWFGGAWFELMVVLAAAGMAWEWDRLCGAGKFGASGVVLIGMLVIVAIAIWFERYGLGILAAALGAGGVALVARKGDRSVPLLSGFGVLYVALPCIALDWLREGIGGRETVVWLLAVIWATDSGAYLAGRTIGGPLLAPKVSPKKTWAGLGGGVVSAALVGWITSYVLDLPGPACLALLSGGLAVVAQGGDLFESAVKRHFGAKDSSTIIPGHGGLLDRLDGLLAAAPVVALLDILSKTSVLEWR